MQSPGRSRPALTVRDNVKSQHPPLRVVTANRAPTQLGPISLVDRVQLGTDIEPLRPWKDKGALARGNDEAEVFVGARRAIRPQTWAFDGYSSQSGRQVLDGLHAHGKALVLFRRLRHVHEQRGDGPVPVHEAGIGDVFDSHWISSAF